MALRKVTHEDINNLAANMTVLQGSMKTMMEMQMQTSKTQQQVQVQKIADQCARTSRSGDKGKIY